MATQFWRTIQPVEGQPIPEGSQYKTPTQRHWSPQVCVGEVFGSYCHSYVWRVPVEVVPIDVAADLLMCAEEWNGKYHVSCGDRRIEADTSEQLRELVIAKLRELSQGNHATD